MTSEYQDLLYDVRDRVATITLNRPEKLNALSPDLIAGLAAYIERAWTDDGVRVVILTGAGRGFCSGQDISGRTIADRGVADDRPPSVADRRHNLRGIQGVGRAVQQLDKPYIAAVNGAAAGAGMDLASMADIRFAATTAKFTQAYSRNALIPGNGGCYFLPRIVGMAKALELIWTGDLFDAQEALRIGYVSKVFPAEKLLDETRAFAVRLAQGPAVAIQLAKRLAYRSMDATLEQALDLAQSAMVIAQSTEDAKEGPRAFAERRTPNFMGR